MAGRSLTNSYGSVRHLNIFGNSWGDGADHGDASDEGFEFVAVGHMHLHATAGFACVFLEPRFEILRPKQHAGKILQIEDL